MAGDGKKTPKSRVKARFKEPSTWAAIAAIAAAAAGIPPEITAGAVGALTTPEGQAAVITAVVAGIVGIALPEGKK